MNTISNTMVFDIETVPDVESGRRLFELHGLNDEDTAKAMAHRQLQKTGTDFMPLHLQKIVAISVVFRSGTDNFKVWTLGDSDAQEAEIITRFFDGIERFSPTIVSWNGSGFDLPVLHYRSMLHGIAAPRYWELGDEDSSFRYNNYINRFHWRHTDLMDVLAGYQMRGRAPLDQIASMMGFPGKMGMSGDKVWATYLKGDIDAIRNYCETDVLNTWLVYLRFALTRGQISAEQFDAECELVQETLDQSGHDHLIEFLHTWLQ
ncbi:MAG: 3'-5' exonuclease [bacterium]